MKSTYAIAERDIDLIQVYQRLPVALCIVGRDGRLLAVNDPHAELAGRPISELIGVRVADLNEEGGRNIKRDFRIFDAGGSVPNHELEIRGRHYMVSVSPVYNSRHEIVAISVAHFDISEKKALDKKVERANKRLKELSAFDHLTKLQNRRQFDIALRARCAAMGRDGENFSMVILDVDHFKTYNDHYGHQAGDLCLKAVAMSVRQSVRRSEATVYRYGGEEFAAIIAEPDQSVAERVANRICSNVRRRSIIHQHSPFSFVTVSCGVASTTQLFDGSSDTRSTARVLIEAADSALYRAKASGRNCVHAYRTGMMAMIENQAH